MIGVLGIGSNAFALTVQEDYDAGLKLYSAQNYAQAIPYFDEALVQEPGNTAALQSRANCYYFLKEYPQALSDYQKVLALEPQNTQVAQFIQTLQAKIGTPSTVPSPNNPSGTDNRMEKRFGLYIGLLSDPMISLGSINAAYNVTGF